jgi:uncharacterized membrane protein
VIFRLLAQIPLLGDVLRIFNAYAYRGDTNAEKRFASLWLWLSAFWLQVGLSLVATLFCMPQLTNRYVPENFRLCYAVDTAPGLLATSILPNLLGFGIGIYALIFGLHKVLLRELQENYKDVPGTKPRPGSALILNAEMAVPLLVLALTIVVGVIQQVNTKSETLQFATWLSLWLSFVFTVELIVTLFGLGDNAILKTLKDSDSNSWTD